MESVEEREIDKSYDVMVNFVVILLLVCLVTAIFCYWCCYYPKVQTDRNDRFYLEQIMESEPEYAEDASFADADDDEESEFIAS